MIGITPLTIVTTQETGDDVHAETITALVADMQAAVDAREVELYLSYVDLSDANFAVEHTNWANNWAEGEYLIDFELDVSDIVIADEGATALLTMTYTTTLEEQPGMTVSLPVSFSYAVEDERWLFAGEYWITTETEDVVIHAAPGLEEAVEILIAEWPAIYETVTNGYGHTPETRMQIKLYESRETIAAMTLLSLPPISGWNEPNESLKSVGTEPERLVGVVAHEFTHYVTFDTASQHRSCVPWWLAEGIALYIAQPFDARGDDHYRGYLSQVKTWVYRDQLVDWEELADYETVPFDLWGHGYSQGYAFVVFLTESYGQETRNRWLHRLADVDLEAATETVYGVTFNELDLAFRDWMLAWQFSQ